MSGPIGKTRAEKELAGNPGNRPLPKELGITPGPPEPPGDLSGEAFAEWCRIVPELHKGGVLATIDRSALVIYCCAWEQYEQARAALEQYGVLVEGQKGNLTRNPATMVMKDAVDTMLKYSAKLGLTPIDRSRLSARLAGDGDHDNDPTADLFAS